MFREEHGRAAIDQPGHHAVEERRVLMGVDNIDVFAPQELSQAPRTAPIDAGLATQHFNRKSFRAQLRTQRAQLIQADEQEPATFTQLPGQARRQHFRAADVERVQHLANGDLGGAVGRPACSRKQHGLNAALPNL